MTTINYSSGYIVWVVRVSAGQGDILVVDVDVFRVCTLRNENCISIVRIVNRRLDIVEVGWATIIDSDYSGLAGNSQNKTGKDKNQFIHISTLLNCFLWVILYRKDVSETRKIGVGFASFMVKRKEIEKFHTCQAQRLEALFRFF
jgi:hypothetical protein